MLKSVWLKNLIVKLLNDNCSVISQSMMVVTSLLNANECEMCLFEPDLNGKTYFAISPKASLVVDKAENDDELVKKVIETKEPIFENGVCLAPLWFENIATFGYLKIKGELKEDDKEKFAQALLTLSYYIYNESLGSIIESSHNSVLKVQNLLVDYKNGKMINRVVNNVSFNINEKEFTMIFGPSGSGKSTILNVLGGMLSASTGNVFYKDQDITDFNDKKKTDYRCNTIGFIFQKYNLINGLTVEENIKIAASLVKNPLTVKEVLDMVGLSGKEKNYPSQLSGGEQQRVSIARALVKRSEVLLCDEPTGALDSENAMEIMKILQHISKEKGIPVVVITHNPNFVVMADHYLRLSNGEIIEDVLQPFALKAESLNYNN